MTIQEQLNIINDTFHKLHRDFARLDAERQSLTSRYSAGSVKIHEKWDAERKKITSIREDVLKYYRIAKDNSSRDLDVAGAAPQKPDIAKLNRMIEQINALNRNDPIAGQIINLASQYAAYLDREINNIASHESDEIRKLNDAVT